MMTPAQAEMVLRQFDGGTLVIDADDEAAQYQKMGEIFAEAIETLKLEVAKR